MRRSGTALRVIVGALLALATLGLAPGYLAPGYLAPGPAASAELVMFERAGCPWCLRWKQEVGPAYPKTEEGRRAPLRMVSLDRGPPVSLQLAEPVFYTPTFVLLNDEGREVGRITGYIGDDAFWGLLTAMVARLGPKAAISPAVTGTPRVSAFHSPAASGPSKSEE